MKTTLCAALVSALAWLGLTPSADAQLFASIAPEARTGRAGSEPVTFFASAINSGNEDLTNCQPVPDNFPAANFAYQTVDAANQLTGTSNTPVTIAGGATQGFLLVYYPPAAGWQGLVSARIQCDQRDSQYAPYLSGTLVVPANGQLPDIIAISATPSGDGVIRMNRAGGRGAMAVAAVNIGAAGNVRVRALDAQYMPGLAEFTVCETDASAQCLSAPVAELTVNFAQDQVRTFAVFAQGQDGGGVPFYPDILRVRLQLLDAASGYTVGTTSAAFTAPDVENASMTAGVYSVFFQEAVAPRGGAAERLDSGLLGILPDGHFYFWGSGSVFGGDHSEWVSHGVRSELNNRLDAPQSYIHMDSTGTLSVVDWFSGINPQTGITGRYQPSEVEPGGQYATVQQSGRFRGGWLSEINRRPTSVSDAQGNWVILSGNAIVGEFIVSETGAISAGRFLLGGFTNCAFSGQLTQQDAGLNIFDIRIAFTNVIAACGQPFNGSTFDGFATLDSLTGGPVPAGTRMPAVLENTAGNNPAGFSFVFVRDN